MIWIFFLLTALQPAPAVPFSFDVRHDHLWGGGPGVLTITAEGLVFEEENKPEHSRAWAFSDIQKLTIESPVELEILTYEDVGRKLGRDRRYRLKLQNREVTPEVVVFLADRLPAPLVTSIVFIPPSAEAYGSIPAKHLHGIAGGCEGTLVLTSQGVAYQSQQADHSRWWPLKVILDAGRMSPYHLRLAVREGASIGNGKTYQFQLKEPLKDTTFDRLWRSLFERESEPTP